MLHFNISVQALENTNSPLCKDKLVKAKSGITAVYSENQKTYFGKSSEI
jgi:hypothetical protein